MNLKFLIAVLLWLQEQFKKAGDRHEANAAALNERIQALMQEQTSEFKNVTLARKLAGKIDNLLSE